MKSAFRLYNIIIVAYKNAVHKTVTQNPTTWILFKN